MTRSTTLFSLLLLFGFGAQAQVSFPTSNTVWTERHGQGEAEPVVMIMALKNADVTLGGHTYHKLYQSADTAIDETDYIGGIREDASHKVWYYSLSTGTERMLYDFDIAIGDTIRNTQSGNEATGTVRSIDTVVLGGVQRKRINFSTLEGTTWLSGSWVEGIGNDATGGLLGDPFALPTCDCALSTLCFLDNGDLVYHNANYASMDCMPALSVASVGANEAVRVFPNPLKAGAGLHLQGVSAYSRVSIMDAYGRIVCAKELKGERTLDMGGISLKPGTYFYKLSGAVGSFSGTLEVE